MSFYFRLRNEKPFFEDITYSFDKKDCLCIQFVELEEKHNYQFTFGKVDSNGDFSEVALEIKTICVSKFYLLGRKAYPSDTTRMVSLPVTVRDSSERKRVFDVKYLDNTSAFIGLENLIQKIYFLESINSIIDNVNLIDPEKINKYFRVPNSFKPVYELIDELRIEQYANSRYVTRKDNKFWTETEVSNFPPIPLISNLLKETLSKHFDGIEETENGYVFYSNFYEAWTSSFDRHKIERNHDEISRIKIRLAFDLGVAIRDRDVLPFYMLIDT